MTQMPISRPDTPWLPMSQPPAPGSYGMVMPTGEPSAASWDGKEWRNAYGVVQAIAWREMPRVHST
jgi:hypothetical protein